MHVLVALPGAELYGSDRVARETVRALLAAGHDVTVTSPTDGPLLALVEGDGAAVARVPVPVLRREFLGPAGAVRLLLTTLRGLPGAWRLLRTTEPGVVVTNTVTLPLWSVLARLRRTRVVVHVHEAEASLPRLLQRVMLAPLLLAHGVVANSEVTRGVVTGVWPRLAARTTVVHNAVAGPAAEPTRAVRHEPARLAYVGRVSARKGVAVAVDAVAALRDAGVEVRLTVTGSVFPGHEPFVHDLHDRIAAGGLDDVVTFADFTPDVWPVLARADVVLMPSVLDESFGNAAVEAVLAARPLVASRRPGVEEATDGYAAVVLVPPADPTALAAAVRGVLADHERFAGLALADAALARDRHTSERYRAQILAAVAPPVAVGPGTPRSR